MTTGANIHNKILANNFKQHAKIIRHSDQEGFVSGLCAGPESEMPSGIVPP